LPLACHTTLQSIPAAVPYLFAEPAQLEYWQAQLGGQGLAVPRIGLAWRGNAVQRNDPRSLPFAAIAPLLTAPACFASLHIEIHVDDAAAVADCDAVQFFGPQLKDFSDTAALIASLDLVITIDTAIAHLAGALGKPVWILLPFNADWRWLTDRSDSPWYPSARLFRQKAPGDWSGVMAVVADELSRFQPKL